MVAKVALLALPEVHAELAGAAHGQTAVAVVVFPAIVLAALTEAGAVQNFPGEACASLDWIAYLALQ